MKFSGENLTYRFEKADYKFPYRFAEYYKYRDKCSEVQKHIEKYIGTLCFSPVEELFGYDEMSRRGYRQKFRDSLNDSHYYGFDKRHKGFLSLSL